MTTPAQAPPAPPAPGSGADRGLPRVEGRDKVTGAATYAYEYLHTEDGQLRGAVGWVVGAAVGAGRVLSVDEAAALARPGVLAVLWHANAPALGQTGDPMLAVLQSDRVAHRGQVVALVVAESAEQAREAAEQLDVRYEATEPDVVLRADHPGLYTPETVNPSFPAVSAVGDLDAGLSASEVVLDATYTTPAEHNHPMEPHATVAQWDGGSLTVWDSNQGGHVSRGMLAAAFEVAEDDVRVVTTHIGGGFGSKGTTRPQAVLATMAARVLGRPVRVALTRQQMFTLVGYRTPTIQRVRLGVDAQGRLQAVAHEAVEQTSTLKEFAEQTTVATRSMYAAPNRLTSHRLVKLDVPIPSWMRAPGECPGMYALESAMDELAVALGMDPVELRVLNEPGVHPESGIAFSSRNLVACLRQGAERFGWSGAQPRPTLRRDGRWLVGTGVAASIYPTYLAPASARAEVAASPSGRRWAVAINATDLGTGARTVLTRIAADELGVPPADVSVQIGDTRLPKAGLAGGSMGTRSWGWAVSKACRALLARLAETDGRVPDGGLSVTERTHDDVKALEKLSRNAFGAQFVEVRVDADTGELRVPRMLGVFAAGRIVNPVTARSQILGGMTMGLSMALHEESVPDARFGSFATQDLASYHVAANADVQDIDVLFVDEDEPSLGGYKGIGEIGIVGTAAAVANAVFDATGVRVRDLPIHLDDVLPRLP